MQRKMCVLEWKKKCQGLHESIIWEMICTLLTHCTITALLYIYAQSHFCALAPKTERDERHLHH